MYAYLNIEYPKLTQYNKQIIITNKKWFPQDWSIENFH